MAMYVAISLLATFALAVGYVFSLEWTSRRTLKGLVSYGFKKEFLSGWRASFRQVSGSSDTLCRGYEKYGINDRPFMVPDTSLQSQVMLPSSSVKWLATQPESILSSEAVRYERNGIRYLPTNLDPKAALLFIDKIIGHSLHQNLDSVHTDMIEELQHNIDRALGFDTVAWTEVDLHEAITDTIDSVTNRILFGSSLCRNTTYLFLLRIFIVLMGISTLVIGQLPPYLLRPFVGLLLWAPTLISKRLALSYIEPLIVAKLQEADVAGKSKPDQRAQTDFVSQSIQNVRKFKVQVTGKPSKFLAEQFLMLAFAGAATSGAAAVNVCLDLFSAPQEIHQSLREEAQSVLNCEGDWNSPESMGKLPKIESAIKESLRRNPLQCRGLLRMVIPKDGIVLPDGSHAPRGTWLGIPVQAIQQSTKHYPNPDSYQPSRFMRSDDAPYDDISNISKLQDAAQPSDMYLSFSYGRFSCPGRWFAARLLKALVAYIMISYDIESLSSRPNNISFGDASIPSFTTKIRVRRRKASWSSK